MSAGEGGDFVGGARDPADSEAAVQRLLAEAGGPVPMPAEVTARLDDVLAGLERERAAGSTGAAGAEVVELRARRRWPRLLLAAAAVVVGGYSVGTVLTQGTLSGSDSDMSAGAESAVMEDSGGGNALRRNADRDGPVAQGSILHLGRPVVVRSDLLETGVRRALRFLDREPLSTADLRGADALKRAVKGCPAPPLDRRERSLLVRYDGERAVLVAGPQRKGPVEVTIYDCSGAELVDTLVRR